jgi:acetyl/propionyl-CoA carboxylase alpha subunit
VTVDYDPMIAKVVAWGPSRTVAIKRLDRALSEFTIKGCTTNTMFLRQLLGYSEFESGAYDTGMIERFQKTPSNWFQDEHKVVALLGAALFNFENERQLRAHVPSLSEQRANSRQISRWRAPSLFRQRPHP